MRNKVARHTASMPDVVTSSYGLETTRAPQLIAKYHRLPMRPMAERRAFSRVRLPIDFVILAALVRAGRPRQIPVFLATRGKDDALCFQEAWRPRRAS